MRAPSRRCGGGCVKLSAALVGEVAGELNDEAGRPGGVEGAVKRRKDARGKVKGEARPGDVAPVQMAGDEGELRAAGDRLGGGEKGPALVWVQGGKGGLDPSPFDRYQRANVINRPGASSTWARSAPSATMTAVLAGGYCRHRYHPRPHRPRRRHLFPRRLPLRRRGALHPHHRPPNRSHPSGGRSPP